jgi:hypothetical protein
MSATTETTTAETSYIIYKFVCLKTRYGSEHNLNSMVRVVFSSLPNLHKKKKPCLLPESDTSDPLVPKVPQNRRGRRPPSSESHECTVEHVHKALLPALDDIRPI